MISNSTIQHYFTEISDTELELFTPILSPVEATLTGLVSGVIAIYGLLTQLSIFRLLKRRSGRGINRIIYYQQVNIYAHPYLCIKVFLLQIFTLMSSCYILYANAARIFYPVSMVIGKVGCYIFDFLVLYHAMLVNTTSFYISLWRYICIVHPGKIRISLTVRARILMNSLISITTLITAITEPNHDNPVSDASIVLSWLSSLQ